MLILSSNCMPSCPRHQFTYPMLTKCTLQACSLLESYVSRKDTDEAVTRLLTPAQLNSKFAGVRLGPSSMLHYAHGSPSSGTPYAGHSNLQAGVPLGLGGDQHAVTPDQLLVAMRLTLQYSTCTSHPLFFNQLYGGPEPAGTAGVAGLSSFVTAHLPAS